ncbi:Bug family tripartite tricarboxylate transporter substrate binding protein [Mesotoga sp. H07.pep.5.3]|uniref:Bug family tripartite tricarboxylate transporter substrate binding protein n=1 Tax=Mesotoga sp. H07.pep.5.3 TaxID=1421003 RepID=UPI000C19A9DD|nr:tripartite tricarboxylate transporter substrate binding protein [Mesotoga sp. H07.pep.5.3]PIJ63361.1 hypothetical protein V513_01640 [Mesotoga sp. H07.pep.5.3]
MKKVLLFSLVLVIAASVLASYPNRSVTLVIPWAAGGITDRVGRAFAPYLEKYLGVPVVVLNQPGASGAIGTDFAYSKPADGYTLLLSAETPGVFRVMGTGKLGFDNFEGIMMLVEDTKVVVVPGNSPYQTMDELVTAIKENPGKIKMSYSGPGASGHIQGLLLEEVGLDVSMTPFGGGSPAMLATISGQVDFTFGNIGTVLDYLKTGDLRALAVYTKEERSPAIPDVPPIADAIPEMARYLPLTFPNCILVKEGTPPEIKQVILEAAQKAVQDPGWIEFTESSFYNRMHDVQGDAVIEYWNRWTSIVAWLLYDAGVAPNSPADFGIERF